MSHAMLCCLAAVSASRLCRGSVCECIKTVELCVHQDCVEAQCARQVHQDYVEALCVRSVMPCGAAWLR